MILRVTTKADGHTTTVVWRRVTPLFLGHLVNDGFGSFFAPLLPLLINRLDLSLAMAGLLGTIRVLLGSFTQPALGYLLDRANRPVLAVVGPVITIFAMGFIGEAINVWQLAVLLILSGLGTALFHPMNAALVAATGGEKRGLAMAFFSAGGTLGGALAPLIIVAYVGALGIARTPWLIIPALGVIVWIAASIHGNTGAYGDQPSPRAEKFSLHHLPAGLAALWFVIVFRSLAGTTFANFLAVLITQHGGSDFLGGVGISVFLLSGAIGGFVGGSLSDRIGSKWVMFWSLLLASPLLLLFLHGPASLSLFFLGLAGFSLFASTPVGIVAAQRLVPGKVGLVSGLVMGFAWGMGGLALTPIGWLADLYGLTVVMSVVSLFPVVGALLVLVYRETSSHIIS